MREEYLHYLWKSQRFPTTTFNAIDGRKVRIIDAGWLNPDGGPDFFNGQIEIDGMLWSGNIEIHINSSDWYRHGHQSDPAYENVILHVVYEYDRPVMIKGVEIMTIELKGFLDHEHLKAYHSLVTTKRFIPCQDSFIPHEGLIRYQLGSSLFHRLERVSRQFELDLIESNIQNRQHVFMVSIAGAFGTRANKLPFQELAKRIPFTIVLKERWNPESIQALVFGVAGLLDANLQDEYPQMLKHIWNHLKSKYELLSMNASSWKFGGVRPYNFPTIKLAQFAHFLTHWSAEDVAQKEVKMINHEFLKISEFPLPDYWENHLQFDKLAPKSVQHITPSSIDLLLINGVVPYLVFLKTYYSDYTAGDKAEELLLELKPEKNQVVNQWKSLGIQPRNAADTQALIELKSQFCDHKRCLNCAFGQAVIEGDKVTDYFEYYS